MYSRKIEELKKKMRLTSRQREVLVGTLLGDGCLETTNEQKTYKLRIEHSVRQKEYVDWFYQEFQSLVHTPPQSRTRFTRLRTVEGMYTRYGFNTLAISALRFYGKQFYPQGKKIVPKLIQRWLTPLALAVWYMDDGSIKSNAHSTILLNTQGFDLASIAHLQEALEQRYEIQSVMRKQPEGFQIYLLAKTIGRFRDLIAPYILPCMEYKIPRRWLTTLHKK